MADRKKGREGWGERERERQKQREIERGKIEKGLEAETWEQRGGAAVRLQCPAPKRCLKYGGKLLVIELVLSGIWTKFLVNLTGRYN